MKGLELSKRYYETFGKPMLEAQFADIASQIAVGLVGQGSECFSFDDKLSTDHDFGACFCMWLPEALMEEHGTQLQNAYDQLPQVFLGYPKRVDDANHLQPFRRHGVQSIEAFYQNYVGVYPLPQTDEEWLRIPSHFLATATNGEVFADPLGRFREIREKLLEFYPEDVVKCKLSTHALQMAQMGQYGYKRAFQRKDPIATMETRSRFVDHASAAIFLLEGVYRPFYKWWNKALDELGLPEGVRRDLTGIAQVNAAIDVSQEIERLCAYVRYRIASRGWPVGRSDFLEEVAVALHDSIENPTLRSRSILR